MIINTTYKELLDLCVNNNITTLVGLVAHFDHKFDRSLFETIKKLNKTENTPLFTKAKQELFLRSDWFDNDYEFYPDEVFDWLGDCYSEDLLVTNYGSVLQRVEVVKYGKTFVKYVERKPFEKNFTYYISIANLEKGKYDCIRLAKLVADKFVEKPKDAKTVSIRFKNGNSYDSHACNLEWC